jgi:dinuclear metal center YbgI/SA1388 family protein
MELLEDLSPVSYAEGWDNVGLLLGRKDKTVHKVMLALDATDDVVQQAVLQGVDMLITHHPLLFSAVKRITEDDFIGRRLINLIKNDICYYAMHTNFDVMGMADAAADLLQLHSCEVLEVTYEDELSKEGIGRIGKLPHEMSLKECAQYCKTVFDLNSVRIYGDEDAPIETIAIVPGAGDDYIKNALAMGADVFITGDIGHHDGLDAMEQGLAVIDASHYGIEKLFVPYMAEVFANRMPELIVIKATQKEPFTVV